MTSQASTQLAPVVIDGRHRAAQEHRYTMPIVSETPRPVGPDALGTSAW
jgi:hypothetical protein